MYDCSTITKLMHAHLDGELDAKESLRMEAHLQECPPCLEAFIMEKAFLDLTRRNLAIKPAPVSARRRISAALSHTGRKHR